MQGRRYRGDKLTAWNTERLPLSWVWQDGQESSRLGGWERKKYSRKQERLVKAQKRMSQGDVLENYR